MFRCSVDLALAIKDASWPDDADAWKTRPRNGEFILTRGALLI